MQRAKEEEGRKGRRQAPLLVAVRAHKGQQQQKEKEAGEVMGHGHSGMILSSARQRWASKPRSHASCSPLFRRRCRWRCKARSFRTNTPHCGSESRTVRADLTCASKENSFLLLVHIRYRRTILGAERHYRQKKSPLSAESAKALRSMLPPSVTLRPCSPFRPPSALR